MRGVWNIEPNEPSQPFRIYVRRWLRLSLAGKFFFLFRAIGAAGMVLGLLIWSFGMVASTYLLLWLWYEPEFRKTAFGPDEDDGLLDSPSTVTQYLVQVMLYRDGTLCGVDKGYVSFVDGWMVFRGACSCWSLGPQHVERCAYPPNQEDLPDGVWSSWRVLPEDDVVILSIRHPSIYTSDRLFSIPVCWRAMPSSEWLEDLDRWSESPRPEQEPLLPPAGARPSALLYPWRTKVAAVWTAVCLAAFTIGSVRYGWNAILVRVGEPSLAMMAMAVVWAMFVTLAAERIRRLRKSCRDAVALRQALSVPDDAQKTLPMARWREQSSVVFRK